MSVRRPSRKKVTYESYDDEEDGQSFNTSQKLSLSALSFMEEEGMPQSTPLTKAHKPVIPRTNEQQKTPKITFSVKNQNTTIPAGKEIFAAKQTRQKAREAEVIDLTSDKSTESDDDWEEQQIKKGFCGIVQKQTLPESVPKPTINTWTGTTKDILRQVKGKLSKARERSSAVDIETIKKDLKNAKSQFEVVKYNRSVLESDYIFFQRLQEHVTTIVDMLNSKLPQMRKLLEESLQNGKSVSERARLLFGDVKEDYYNIHEILQEFKSWKDEYGDSYDSAYGVVCLGKLLAPLVEFEMIDWDPLGDDCKGIETYAWFDLLFTYCLHRYETVVEKEIVLMSVVVEKAVLKRLGDIVDTKWDVGSSKMCRNLAEVIKYIFGRYPIVVEESKEACRLFEAIRLKVEKAMAVSIPLYSSEVLACRGSREVLYFFDCLWGAVDLFLNLSLLSCVVSKDFNSWWVESLLVKCILVALRRAEVGRQVVKICLELLRGLGKVGVDWGLVSPFLDFCCDLVVTLDGEGFDRRILMDFVRIIREIGAVEKANMLNDILTIH